MDSNQGHPTERLAFERAYREHRERLVTLAAALTGDRVASEDIVHDVFAMLTKERWRLRNGSNPSAFLTTCVRNKALDAVRLRKRRRLPDAADPNEWLDKKAQEPMLQAVEEEETQRLLAAVAALPEDLRDVVSLRIWGEMTFEDICRVQDVAASTAHSRYQAALEALRRILQDGEGVTHDPV